MPVEKFSGTFVATDFSDAIEKAKETIQVVMLNRAKKEQEAVLKLQQEEEEYKLAVRNDASKQCRTRTNELCTTQTNSNDIEAAFQTQTGRNGSLCSKPTGEPIQSGSFKVIRISCHKKSHRLVMK